MAWNLQTALLGGVMGEHLRWSDGTVEDRNRLQEINSWYRQALQELQGGKLYGKSINLDNPKEVIATLYIMYKDITRFHEPF